MSVLSLQFSHIRISKAFLICKNAGPIAVYRHPKPGDDTTFSHYLKTIRDGVLPPPNPERTLILRLPAHGPD